MTENSKSNFYGSDQDPEYISIDEEHKFKIS